DERIVARDFDEWLRTAPATGQANRGA
ncbi:MAG: hypothetical protein JWP76_5982, partial [Dactylosporangium sp.]|nr:hypothetical protein [Dactylosporangium sp.]